MALVNLLHGSFWTEENRKKVQRGQLKEGFPIRQLRELQLRLFEEEAESSLSLGRTTLKAERLVGRTRAQHVLRLWYLGWDARGQWRSIHHPNGAVNGRALGDGDSIGF